MTWRDIPRVLKEAFQDWNDDNAPRLGAALSYYTIFSIAPLLMISIFVAGLAFGGEAAQGQIVGQIEGLIGTKAAEAVQAMLENARRPGEGLLATVLGTAALLFGAGGAFNELRSAMNQVWEITPPQGGGIMTLVRQRLLSFGMVLVVGFLLLVSLVVSAAISLLELKDSVPGGGLLVRGVNLAVSLGAITVLFALIFKYLPDADPPIAWRDTWFGAFFTAFLFTVGKFGIGLYLGRSSVASTYGAAGSLVLLLVWVYYSAQILFFGAEVTQVVARRHGSRLFQDKGKAAEDVDVEDDAEARDEDEAAEGGPLPAARRPEVWQAPSPATASPGSLSSPVRVGIGLAWSVGLILLAYADKKR